MTSRAILPVLALGRNQTTATNSSCNSMYPPRHKPANPPPSTIVIRFHQTAPWSTPSLMTTPWSTPAPMMTPQSTLALMMSNTSVGTIFVSESGLQHISSCHPFARFQHSQLFWLHLQLLCFLSMVLQSSLSMPTDHIM